MDRARRLWPRWAATGLLMGGLWLIIAGTDPASWLIGLPVVVYATHTRLKLRSGTGQQRLAPAGVPRFVAFFLRESLRGGLDVAARTLGPRLRIDPGLLTYTPGLPAGPARVLFANCVSLLPGTLTAEFSGEKMLIHVLDAQAPVADELRALEQAIAGLFPTAGEANHA